MTRSSVASRLVEPTFSSSPDRVETLGPEVAEMVALCSDDKGPFILDPEQRLVLDDIFGVGVDGKASAFEVGLIACRQNLKTGVFKAAALGKLYVREQRLVVWSAHEFFAAAEAFRDLRIMIESSPDLDREVLAVRTAAGSESIELQGDRRLIFKARSTGSGRSLSGDTVILDEGFALQPGHMGALLPTLAARPDPQVLVGSSAGLAGSAVLRALRDKGRKGAPRVAYREWCAPERECADPKCPHLVGWAGCALDDVDLWLAANTAIQRGRITVETIAGLRQAMPPDQFARECLGWWDEPAGESAFGVEAWGECLDASSRVASGHQFALDVAPDRSWSAIVVAGRRADGLAHVEITSRDQMDHRPGTDWLVPRFRELLGVSPGLTVRIVTGGGAEAIAPALEALGCVVARTPGKDVGAACGLTYDRISARQVRHIGQPELDAAVVGARRRNVGEGTWVLGRRVSAVDITPAYGMALALWGLETEVGSNGFNIW